MKKLLLFGLVVGLVVSAKAQVAFRSYSFLAPDIASITSSNTFMVTNLATAWVGLGVTNMTGITYTNKAGTRTIVVGAATGNTKNLIQDVPLWASREGFPMWGNVGTNNGAQIDLKQSFLNLAVVWDTGSGLDQAVTFVFTPIMNGLNEVTTAAEEWSVAFTPTASSVNQCLTTNVPIWRWPGASKLRLRRYTFSDTSATSQLVLKDLSVNGFVPQ